MECKKCYAEIGIAVAAETTRHIKRFCEAAGMAPDAVATFASQRGPLCLNCLEQWETGGDEAGPPDGMNP